MLIFSRASCQLGFQISPFLLDMHVIIGVWMRLLTRSIDSKISNFFVIGGNVIISLTMNNKQYIILMLFIKSRKVLCR